MVPELGQALFFGSPTATVLVDSQGQIADINASGTRTLGRPRERLLGTPVLKWVIPEDRDRAGEFVVALERLSRWLRDF